MESGNGISKMEKWQEKKLYKIGVENGFFKEYASDGSIISEGEYVDGVEDGSWLYSYLDYKEEGKYNNGRRDGIWKHYFSDGKLRFEGEFIDGMPNGRHKLYWDNGNIKEEGNYVMGAKEGEWKKNNEDGTPFLITLYIKMALKKAMMVSE